MDLNKATENEIRELEGIEREAAAPAATDLSTTPENVDVGVEGRDSKTSSVVDDEEESLTPGGGEDFPEDKAKDILAGLLKVVPEEIASKVTPSPVGTFGALTLPPAGNSPAGSESGEDYRVAYEQLKKKYEEETEGWREKLFQEFENNDKAQEKKEKEILEHVKERAVEKSKWILEREKLEQEKNREIQRLLEEQRVWKEKREAEKQKLIAERDQWRQEREKEREQREKEKEQWEVYQERERQKLLAEIASMIERERAEMVLKLKRERALAEVELAKKQQEELARRRGEADHVQKTMERESEKWQCDRVREWEEERVAWQIEKDNVMKGIVKERRAGLCLLSEALKGAREVEEAQLASAPAGNIPRPQPRGLGLVRKEEYVQQTSTSVGKSNPPGWSSSKIPSPEPVQPVSTQPEHMHPLSMQQSYYQEPFVYRSVQTPVYDERRQNEGRGRDRRRRRHRRLHSPRVSRRSRRNRAPSPDTSSDSQSSSSSSGSASEGEGRSRLLDIKLPGKIPTYNGSVKWQFYDTQFKMITKPLGLNDQEKVQFLVQNLRDEALGYYCSLSKETKKSYRKTAKKMADRFGGVEPAIVARRLLFGLKQEVDETVEAFGQRCGELAREGYPRESQSTIRRAALDAFFRGVLDQKAALSVLDQEPSSIRSATKLMKKMVANVKFLKAPARV